MATTLLKYAFRAHFANGEVYDQPPDDKSRFAFAKSSFYDVQYRQDQLLRFELRDRAGRFAAAVDLIDGHFEYAGGAGELELSVTGSVVRRVEPARPDVPFGPYRLIYFRRVRQHQTGSRLITEVEYHLGWQVTTVDGRNFQQTIHFD